MRIPLTSPLVFLLSIAQCLAWTATPFKPPSYPLAVRSPYLSTWLPQGAGNALNDVWPQFWTGSTLGWAGFVKVDGKAYTYLGAPVVGGTTFTKATQKSATFTSTQSIFVLSAGPVDITVTFLSPVEAKDLTKYSLPFSYMAVKAVSTDGNSHSVQVYSDISGEWVTGDVTLTANWGTTTDSNIITHQVQLSSQTTYKEVNDHVQYGAAYYSIASGSGVTYQTGQDTVVRANFINNGNLPNSQDTGFRAVQDRWPVFAFAQNLGNVGTSQSTSVVFTVGHVRNPAIQYIVSGGGLQDRKLFFFSKYQTALQAIAAFLPDYSNALSRANAFDTQVHNDAAKISNDYANLVALSIRQTVGATELTVAPNDNNDIIMFMKEISSDGNVNTVDVIFPSWPAWLYLNPDLGKYLLLGLFKYEASGQYPNKWSVHDIGGSYPKATGHNDGKDEAMPVEESGNMLIMTLSHYLKTNDKSLISTYTSLLDQWTQFLIEDSLIPNNQLSTDDFAGQLANQTNLAIKGIAGIQAMSAIYGVLGNSAKQSQYATTASNYVKQWQGFAQSTSGAHLTLNYNNPSSWGLSYNLYADKLLKFGLFPQSVYQQQTAWYKTVGKTYGVPLDTRHTYTKSDWSIWTAAIVTDTATRDLFISDVVKYASDPSNNGPLSDWYETTNGASQGFRARPVVGGHLALLVL